MTDLIDRNSLLNSLEKFAPEKHDALVEMLIKKEPTVDVVPVIRCKDCKWYGDGYLCYNTETLGMQPDDYCSLAERREE